MKSFTLECKWPISCVYNYNPDSMHEQQCQWCGQCVSGCPVSVAGVEWREGEVGCIVVNMINC